MKNTLTVPAKSELGRVLLVAPNEAQRRIPEPSRPEREPDRVWPQPTPRWDPEPRQPSRDWPTKGDPTRKNDLPGHEPRKPR